MGTMMRPERDHTPGPVTFLIWIATGLVCFFSLHACYGTDVTKPPEGKGTSYPCGVWGVECSDGGCCPWAHVCGVAGDPWRRCEVGYCCADGDPLYGSVPDAAPSSTRRSTPVKQRRPQ